MKTKIIKFNTQKALSVDEQNHTIDFVVSTEDRDRQGDVVKQAGWDTDNYEKNPTVLFGHDSWSFPIGKSLELIYDDVKKWTVARIKFAVEEYDKAETAFKLCKGGYLNTTSVGFINKEREGNELQVNELLEISIVPIPANPNAIALAFEAGDIAKDDAQWLMKNFESSIDSLKKSMQNKKEGNIMTDEEKQLLNKTAETVSELKSVTDTILENQTKMLDGMTAMQKSFKKADDGEGEGDDTQVAGDPATVVPNPDDAPVVPTTTDDDGNVIPAKPDNDDGGAREVTVDTEVDPDNLSDDEAKLFQAELQKQLDGKSE